MSQVLYYCLITVKETELGRIEQHGVLSQCASLDLSLQQKMA